MAPVSHTLKELYVFSFPLCVYCGIYHTESQSTSLLDYELPKGYI